MTELYREPLKGTAMGEDRETPEPLWTRGDVVQHKASKEVGVVVEAEYDTSSQVKEWRYRLSRGLNRLSVLCSESFLEPVG